MTYKVFDSETETHQSHKRKANPFHPDNYVVMRGWKNEGDTRCSMQHFTGKTADNYLRIEPHVTVLVGHQIKFDLLYEMCNNNPDLKAFFKRGGRVWCTQYAYYLLNAQSQKSQMVAMDTVVEEYGGRKKIDGMKALWEAGYLTSQIDPAMVEDYLIGTEDEGRNSGDIGNTELIYQGQIQEAEDLGMTAAIKARMDGLCATTEMEFNGIKVDVKRAAADLKLRTAEFKAASAELEQYISHIPEEVGFGWGSGQKVSCLLYGGTICYQKQTTYIDEATGQLARLKAVGRWPLFGGASRSPDECEFDDKSERYFYLEDVPGDGDREAATWYWQDTYLSGKKKGEGKFKNVSVPGELKVKFQDFFFECEQITPPKDEWKLKTLDGTGKPCYGTGSEIIATLALRDIPFLKLMGKWQALSKEIGTYYARYDESKKTYVGMLTCVSKSDHIVHHSLNHSSTVTTRLSSNNPNLQNIPTGQKSDVKAMFISRFLNGVVGELDYSQLEVVVQGLLSGDKNLIRDLCAKIDFHCKRVALKNSVSYDFALFHCKNADAPDYAKWNNERRNCKSFSFERAYGAGAASISEKNGIPIDDVKAMITAEEKEYPGVVKFNADVEAEVNRTAEPFRDHERGYRVFRKGTWQAPTGTMYAWRSWDAPSFMRQKGIPDTFSPPELKNYPVQGTGGEIVQMVLGYVWRWFMRNDNFGGRALLTNTVHDCIWVDMHPDVVDVVIPGMKKIMQAVPQILKKLFNIDCPVPFPVDAETGSNMLELKHYTQGSHT
jgi:DNA polymerase I-like protein with 3'-5' exonuclease and polymerase domains